MGIDEIRNIIRHGGIVCMKRTRTLPGGERETSYFPVASVNEFERARLDDAEIVFVIPPHAVELIRNAAGSLVSYCEVINGLRKNMDEDLDIGWREFLEDMEETLGTGWNEFLEEITGKKERDDYFLKSTEITEDLRKTAEDYDT